MDKKKRIWLLSAALAVLAVLAAVILLLPEKSSSEPKPVVAVEAYDLYWNLDAAEYWSEDDLMSLRKKEKDGFYHLRVFHDGEELVIKTKKSAVVSTLDGGDLFGLEFDEAGNATEALRLKDLPLQQVCWRWYVQQLDGNMLTVDSSYELCGKRQQLDISNAIIYDMTGMSGAPGTQATLMQLDRIYPVANNAGEITHIFIVERYGYSNDIPAMCEHCGEMVGWVEWTKKNTLPISTGHYILKNDIALNSQHNINPDSKICLDLNGHTVTGKMNKRIYSLHYTGSELSIMDSSPEKQGKLVASGTDTDEGLCVWVRYGKFNLYGGTLDATEATSIKSGTAVCVNKDTVFNMYGGTIAGGTSKYALDPNTQKPIRGLAGSVYVRGEFNFHNGLIRDGKAKALVETAGSKKTYYQGCGGNVYVNSQGVMHMSGGTIRDGEAENCAGNIYVDGVFHMSAGTVEGGRSLGQGRNGGSVLIGSSGTMHLSGGTITGGTTMNYGGNIYCVGTLNMSGGTVTDGISKDYKTGKADKEHPARNILVANGTFSMSGGSVVGGSVQVSDTKEKDGKQARLNLSGTARITGAAKGVSNLTIGNGGDGVIVKVGKMSGNAKIGVNFKGIFSEKTSSSNQKYFTSDLDYAQVCYTDEKLAIGQMGCVCGRQDHVGSCDGKQEYWLPWTSSTGVPVTEGNYYLTKDVAMDYQANIKGESVNLNLNGHNIVHTVRSEKADAFRLYRLQRSEDGTKSASLVITDHTQNPGTLKSDMSAAYTGDIPNGQALRDAGNYGMLVWVQDGSFTLYNGVLDGSNLSGNKNGIVIRVEKDSQMHMHGGTILGGTTIMAQDISVSTGELKWNTDKETGLKTSPVWIGGKGGAVAVYGSMTMTGGTISGGKAYAATGILNPDTGLTNEPSYSGGGNVYVSGQLIMSGGSIENGSVFDSVYECVDATQTKTKYMGAFGGNLLVYGSFELTGGTISGGSTNKTENAQRSTGNGGNIRVDSVGIMIMSGGTVSGGTSGNCGGNMVVYGHLDMSDGLVEGGTAPSLGKNLFLVNCEANLSGGTVAGDVYLSHSADTPSGLTLTGTITIPMGQQYGLYVPEGKLITVENLTAGAHIDLEANSVFTVPTDGKNAEYFKADGQDVFWQESGLTVGILRCGICAGAAKDHGHICQEHMQVYQAWSQEDTLPVTSGCYYLTKDVTLTSAVSVREEAVITLDLNGHNITNNGAVSGRTYALRENVPMELTLANSQPNGQILLNARANAAMADEGILVWGRYASSTIRLYGIRVDAQGLTGNPAKAGTLIKTAGALDLYGCTMLANTEDSATDIYTTAKNSLIVEDCELTAALRIQNTASIQLRGSVRMTALTLSSGLELDVTQLRPESRIGLDAFGKFTGPADAALAASFNPLAPQDRVIHKDGCLWVDYSQRCMCGSMDGTHKGICTGPVTWTLWEKTDSLPKTTGNYILTQNVTCTGNARVKDGSRVVLDLNGKTVTGASNKRIYDTFTGNGNELLVFCDGSADSSGCLKANGAMDEGGVVAMAKGTLYLYSGVLDASNYTTNTNASGAMKHGAAVSVSKNVVFKMYGGKIIGGRTGTLHTKTEASYGGAIAVLGTMDMYGGTVTGGYSASRGGNIYISGTMNLYGGCIVNGTAAQYAGNIYVYNGTLNVSGGSISGGAVDAELADCGKDIYQLGGTVYLNTCLQDLDYAGDGTGQLVLGDNFSGTQLKPE